MQKRSINKEIMLARLTEHIKPSMEETVMEDIEDMEIQDVGNKVTRNIILTNDELKELFDMFNEYIKKQIRENRKLERALDEEQERGNDD